MLHLVATALILKSYSEIKGIVSISERNSYPYISSFGVLQPNCITSATIISFDNCFFIVFWHFGLSEHFSMFIDKTDFDDSIFFCNLNASFPDHVFPVIEVVSFGCWERRKFEDGDSLCLIAKNEFGWLHYF